MAVHELLRPIHVSFGDVLVQAGCLLVVVCVEVYAQFSCFAVVVGIQQMGERVGTVYLGFVLRVLNLLSILLDSLCHGPVSGMPDGILACIIANAYGMIVRDLIVYAQR